MGSHGAEIAIRDQTVTGLTMAEPAYTDAEFTISDSTRIRLADSVPANTRRACTCRWSAFTDWCTANGGRVPAGTGGRAVRVLRQPPDGAATG
jgi:hypothetical protein